MAHAMSEQQSMFEPTPEEAYESKRRHWEKVLEQHVAELEHALGVPRPHQVVECLAHTLANHPPLEVDEDAMGRVILLLTVAFEQGQNVERKRLAQRVHDEVC